MSKLNIVDMKGQAKGEFDFADGLLVLDKGGDAVHQVVVAHMAARHQGTSNTLGKGDVAGSNKKPWKQKGTGMARAGYRQSPIWRGGGVAHGPHPRSYDCKVSRKTRSLAFRRALSERIEAGKVIVVDKIELASAKTKEMAAFLKTLKVAGPVLVVVTDADRNVRIAAKNIPGVEVVCCEGISTYQVVRYPTIVASSAAMETLKQRLAENGTGVE